MAKSLVNRGLQHYKSIRFLTQMGVKDIQPKKHRESESVLKKLLGEPGVDLPMASTLLRFKNPQVFQIIDRHAYRALYGKKYPPYSKSTVNKKIEVYFKYLNDLIGLSELKKVQFSILDRLLYVFDKQHNGKLNAKQDVVPNCLSTSSIL